MSPQPPGRREQRHNRLVGQSCMALQAHDERELMVEYFGLSCHNVLSPLGTVWRAIRVIEGALGLALRLRAALVSLRSGRRLRLRRKTVGLPSAQNLPVGNAPSSGRRKHDPGVPEADALFAIGTVAVARLKLAGFRCGRKGGQPPPRREWLTPMPVTRGSDGLLDFTFHITVLT